ncbi:hypothetical protein, conserved in T.vivax [Trypanosoma vivax Y486]|uniref:Uncharacterized protein n=1 Tax=Trypanosoma vivax (strain Y486) TaxID=1055687 RepID=F9WU61_TRYVY|nr:hypothetical protein, conserved in T.vivax [Trypanosoma vivax Y486]|eukprot:CCD21109.1 hypothetical protein, conserved in T.vivax [Trypanosoma vivax Y486]
MNAATASAMPRNTQHTGKRMWTACTCAGLSRMVSTTFLLISEFALKASYSVVKLKLMAVVVKKKAALAAASRTAMNVRVERSRGAPAVSGHYIAKCQSAVQEAEGVNKTGMTIARSRFDGGNQRKKKVKQLLENFAVCKSIRSVITTPLDVCVLKLSQISLLWPSEETKQMLRNHSSEKARIAIKNVSTGTKAKLMKHLGMEVLPPADVMLLSSVAVKGIIELEKLVTTVLEGTIRKLVHVYDSLCNAGRLLTALPFLMNSSKKGALHYSTTVKRVSVKANENGRSTGQYTGAPGTILPALSIGITIRALGHGRELMNRDAKSGLTNAASMPVTTNKC